MLELETHVQFVKGIGPRLAQNLAERRIVTVEDLLYHLPFRYEDRVHPRDIATLQSGEMVTLIGEVRGALLMRTRSMPLFEITVGQGMGTVKCMWFHGSYLNGKIIAGQKISLYGKVEASRSRPGNFKMVQPQFEILEEDGTGKFLQIETGRIVPVYESLGGTTPWGAKLTSRWLRRVLWELFEELSTTSLPETLPADLCARWQMPSRLDALRQAHFPPGGTAMSALQSASTPAHRRLIFEELFYLELGLELKRRRLRDKTGIAFSTTEKVRAALKQVLPFHPTTAQKRSLAEIVGDMRQPLPMRRLLQGDVGSGKTIVAIEAALIAIENGYQAALMAPTEILATQHYLSARRMLNGITSPTTGKPYSIALLTGSLDEDRKRHTRGRIRRGEADLVIGTHALIEEKVDFASLGLIIVDEQHRFGVQQRFRLMKKPGAAEPDMLVMTATPIPRTLALTLYGDLDLSILDELPPGRTPIITRRTSDERAADVWDFLRKQIAKGHQAYIVYPVIEGAPSDQPELDFPQDPAEETSPAAEPAPQKSAAKKTSATKSATKKIAAKKSSAKPDALFPKPTLKSATAMYDSLRTGALNGLRLGLLHGRLSSDEKESVMRRFQAKEIDVLVSTTVIEVGVDVPNSTVMVIEHAERFGLAQMHQLRGRVGRGAAKSYCILMTGARVSPQAEQRLDAMVRTQNGFELAELDLALRGPGEFFGTRQAGLPDFRVANLLRDRKLLELAKQEAARFAAQPDPAYTRAEIEAVWARLRDHWQRRYGLLEAG